MVGMTDEQMIWPVPFGGITCVVRFPDVEAIKAAIHWLSGEGRTCKKHLHNIAVSFDDLEIYSSELGGHCMKEFFDDWTN
jgi:hypothetical protein